MKKPLILAHMGGRAHGKENSAVVVRAVSRYDPDIIELDIRKSRDGILYCYHGSLPFGYLFANLLLRRCSFARIQKVLEVDTMVDVLSAITGKPILYLDIKERNISAHDMDCILRKFHQFEVWIAAYSLSYLKKFRKQARGKYVYMYNAPFWFWRKGAQVCVQEKFHHQQLFSWQCTPKTISYLRKFNVRHQAHYYSCWPRRRYYELIAKYGSVLVSYDDLQHARVVSSSQHFS